MGLEFAYKPAKLERALNNIRKSYPSYSEFVSENHNEKYGYLLETLSSIEDKKLPGYVDTLLNTEIDYLIPALECCNCEATYRRIEFILVSRFRKKLYELAWSMLQRDYENRYLSRCILRLAELLNERFPGNYSDSIFYRLQKEPGNDADQVSFPERIYNLLISDNADVAAFFKKYSISPQSPLSEKVCELFFLNCSSEGYKRNRSVFAGFLEVMSSIKAGAFVPGYLSKLEVAEYFDEVNYHLIERYGEPKIPVTTDADAFWKRLPPDLCYKFHRWADLKRMECHFGEFSNKFKFWASRFDRIKGIKFNDTENILFIDLGAAVIVDLKTDLSENTIDNIQAYGESSLNSDEEPSAESPNSYYSYIYDRDYFDTEWSLYEKDNTKPEGGRRWRIITEHSAKARDFVIEGRKAHVYKVGYEKIQLLYFKEIIKFILEDAVR